ncbi:unnamed protein product [Lasius platythorax]|uniref:Uncharacterized protein n=1 Tax=Lasius platythorax TaxID=488582 RepID=A0AAV2NLP6_9HYME
MKANTGNGKLPDTKERKSGHCELQRTAWKSTVDIQFGQTRGTNKKKGKKKRTDARARGLRYCRKPPTSEPISTVADVICRVFPDVRRAELGWESIAARNNLQPFELDVSASLFRERAARHGYRVYLSSEIRSIM